MRIITSDGISFVQSFAEALLKEREFAVQYLRAIIILS